MNCEADLQKNPPLRRSLVSLALLRQAITLQVYPLSRIPSVFRSVRMEHREVVSSSSDLIYSVLFTKFFL